MSDWKLTARLTKPGVRGFMEVYIALYNQISWDYYIIYCYSL